MKCKSATLISLVLLVGGGGVPLDGGHRQVLQVPHLGLDPGRVGRRLLNQGHVFVAVRLDPGGDAGQGDDRQRCCDEGQEVQEPLHLVALFLENDLENETRSSSADRLVTHSPLLVMADPPCALILAILNGLQ